MNSNKRKDQIKLKNNEQYGIAVEVFLANLFNVEMNEEYKKRASIELFNKLEEKSTVEGHI